MVRAIILWEELLQKGWWWVQGPCGPGRDDYDLSIRGAGVRTHMNRRRGPSLQPSLEALRWVWCTGHGLRFSSVAGSGWPWRQDTGGSWRKQLRDAGMC